MTNPEILILALALAIDAMLVSFSYGLLINYKRIVSSLSLAFAFGFFQFFMPVIGFFLTGILYSRLEVYSKWIVFFIFIFLGLRFLKNAFEKEEEIKEVCITLPCLLCLAVATSIDAFGAGVSVKFLNADILKISVVIGIITFLLSFFGFWVANIFKKLPSKPVEITGAMLLIYLAIKAILF